MSYNGMSKKIKNALKTVLQGITYDTGGGAEPAFVSVLDNTKDEFDGYPSMRILPNNINSSSAATGEFDHKISYALLMSFPLESTLDIESTTYDHMYDLTDLVIDTIEHADYVGQLSQIDSTIQNWMMNVPQSRWYVGQGKAGALLLAEITVELTYKKDLF